MPKQKPVEIDERRLTRDERREYARRGKDLAPEVKERWAGHLRLVHAFQATCLVAGVLVAVVGASTDIDALTGVGGFAAAYGAVFWMLVPGWVEDAHGARAPRILAQQAADYLNEIGYATRPTPRSSRARDVGDDGGPNYWATGGYDPDAFRRIVASHSQHELDSMRDYGMTADEWDANRPD
ncbi:hypothetical protein [Cellulosimicrobium funkei]|uniref:hypothetical protein n=1 Tax=Cellulosimicrobium funkei TaxID=264251 RepID=UPI003427F4C6